MSVINPDNKKMILACDGGGIRGIIIARCLEKLESIEGRSCNKIFHLMTGTSTGAIIVAALAIGMPAKELVKLYLVKGRAMFKKNPHLWRRLFKWKYTKAEVKKNFREIFGDITLKELPVDIMITAKDTVRSETMFFEKKTFGNMLLREAVESSMSAPTYFAPNGRYIDGGVGGFNNPCYQAAVEAIHYLNYPRARLRMLSFGTGREINNMQEGEAQRKYKLGWLTYAIGEGMEDANEQQVGLVRREYVRRNEVEFRRYQLSFTPSVLTNLGIPIEQMKDAGVFKMDAVKHLEILDLIARKFADYITFTEKDGVELGEKPKLQEKDFARYLKH